MCLRNQLPLFSCLTVISNIGFTPVGNRVSEVSRVFKRKWNGVSGQFQGSFRKVTWMFQGSINGVIKSVKGVSRKIIGCLEDAEGFYREF